MATPDLVTFSASGVHPVYAYYFHPQHGEGYNPLWYDHSWGGTPPLFTSGIMLRFFVKMCPGATFGARIAQGSIKIN